MRSSGSRDNAHRGNRRDARCELWVGIMVRPARYMWSGLSTSMHTVGTDAVGVAVM